MTFKSNKQRKYVMSKYSTSSKKYDKTELAMGRKIEREHSKTYSKYADEDAKKSTFYDSIAKDHLNENPKYYSKLKKTGL